MLPDEIAIARLGAADPVPSWAGAAAISSITRTAEELSIVSASRAIPPQVQAERGWRCLRVAGTLEFSMTGVIASLAAPLAAAGVSIFAISTYDTDYILVRDSALQTAIACLIAAGHHVDEA